MRRGKKRGKCGLTVCRKMQPEGVNGNKKPSRCCTVCSARCARWRPCFSPSYSLAAAETLVSERAAHWMNFCPPIKKITFTLRESENKPEPE